MTSFLRIYGLVFVFFLTSPALLWAQEEEPTENEEPQQDRSDAVEADESQQGEDTAGEDAPVESTGKADEETPPQPSEDADEEADPADATTTPSRPGPGMETDDDQWPQDWDDGAFDDFGEDIDFVPLEDLDDGLLDRLTTLQTFPFVEFDGMLRVRSRARIDFDLGTGGTSAVLPPLDTVVPAANPANPDAGLLWTTDLRLRLAPTFHLRETLRIHTDFDFLRNIALGDDPRHSLFATGAPSPDRRLMASGPASAAPVFVRQAYGEVDTFFGTILAGRILNHWGLGIFANDGNCADCDWGNQVDRLALRTRIFRFDVMAAYDFPDIGLSSNQFNFDYGHPYELTGLDTTRQWTASVSHSPITRQDRELQAHRLGVEELPVFNGGLYFSSQTRDGEFLTESGFDPDAPSDPIYRGLQTYTASPWFQFLWQPSDDLHLRVELEGLASFGRIDNPGDGPVGFEESTGEPRDVNCFDSESRDNNPVHCTTDASGNDVSTALRQFGLALETEFDVGGPVSFGLNGGFATGGDSPNWGYRAATADRLAFTRFSPDYHVDLILFREVIGTVTNAYYLNPYVTARFLDTGLQRMEFQLDFLGSRAFDAAGTPGDSPWLGLELDGSLRFLATNSFIASIDGGVLFPLGGLAARAGRERLNAYQSIGPFTEDVDPGLAWTVQGSLTWSF